MVAAKGSRHQATSGGPRKPTSFEEIAEDGHDRLCRPRQRPRAAVGRGDLVAIPFGLTARAAQRMCVRLAADVLSGRDSRAGLTPFAPSSQSSNSRRLVKAPRCMSSFREDAVEKPATSSQLGWTGRRQRWWKTLRKRRSLLHLANTRSLSVSTARTRWSWGRASLSSRYRDHSRAQMLRRACGSSRDPKPARRRPGSSPRAL